MVNDMTPTYRAPVEAFSLEQGSTGGGKIRLRLPICNGVYNSYNERLKFRFRVSESRATKAASSL